MSEPVFKPCMQNQPMLFPPDVSDLIPANAMVRTVDSIVNSLDRKTLTDLYPGGGTSAYDPSMMLKYAQGSKLADMRKSLGLTQKQVARELNVPNVRLSEIERDVCPHEEIRREYDRYLNAKMSANKGLDSL